MDTQTALDEIRSIDLYNKYKYMYLIVVYTNLMRTNIKAAH